MVFLARAVKEGVESHAMVNWSVALDMFWGWGFWSLSHNLGHRWWHNEMKRGLQTFYAHGEREHHRIYDGPVERPRQIADDPKELFISFPLIVIAPVGLLVAAAYGYFRGWTHAIPFGAAMYAVMILDHRLHIQFHKIPHLNGALGWFQKMHMVHHATHTTNFFFVSGLLWDVLLRTAVLNPDVVMGTTLTAPACNSTARGSGSPPSRNNPSGSAQVPLSAP